ncbi:hypothetical protein CIT292_07896 [Citrobacter youngae ATCC 29220]|uniref:Uncharacterized protein n=1 Tax=Citrobacter youngae ATCC 29220 TaxID=500640 RepID=D4BBV6_9ENTR|nr:hypothetical protein CIT292_07896 [Citrobacter youngae ATCC 29220]
MNASQQIKSKSVSSSGLVSRQPAIIAQFFPISLQTNRVFTLCVNDY